MRFFASCGKGLEYLLVDERGEIVGVLATADVDRAFREGQH